MKFSAYAYTNRGGRDSNEDSIRCQIQGQRGAFLVADGLGGHQSGEVASALAADVILAGCTAGAAPDRDALLDLFQAANQELRRQQAVPGQGWGMFLHCTAEGYPGSSGCICIPEPEMKLLLQQADERTKIVILEG